VLRETEVDGVPTVVTSFAGPLNAGLMFRVGRADETASRTGITHLVEHLALFQQGLADYHSNGATGPVTTQFNMSGSESDVVAFLSSVCTALTDLPMHRVPTEKEILRTEAHSRRPGANHSLPMWRYGAAGYGLLSYPEWGLHDIGPGDLRAWVQRWFTRENAVLWIAGADVPAGLRLPLPSGERMPVPAPSSALPVTPAYFAEGADKVVFDAVVRASMAASMFSTVLERELFRALRKDGGYSYTTTTDYEPRGDDHATLTALVDSLPDKQAAVLGGFVDALARLRLGNIDPADLAAVRGMQKEHLNHPLRDVARLPRHCTNILVGRPNPSVEELLEQVEAVTLDDLHAVAQEAVSTGLLQVPAGHSADWAGFTAAPTSSTTQARGTAYAHAGNGEYSLVIGHDGVSVVGPHAMATVFFASISVALAYPDGARHLVGTDGIVVRVEPTLYLMNPEAIGFIDARLRPEALVHLPARPADQIPQPRQTRS
jgi:predicted Zn-dependent peptidase